MRRSILVLAVTVAGACAAEGGEMSGGGSGAGGKADGPAPLVVDLHDVSVLFPLPSWADREQLIDVRSAGRGSPILPRERFHELTMEGSSGLTLREDIPPPVATSYFYDQGRLRVVAARVDPCFRIEPMASCQPELRLVVQPIQQDGDAITTMDAALHLAYALTEDELYRGIVPSLMELNERFGAAYCGGATGERVACRSLGVHPVIVEQGLAGQYATQIKGLISTYAGSENLTRMTFMDVDSPGGTIWTFGAFEVRPDTPGDALVPLPVPTLSFGGPNAVLEGRQTFSELGTAASPDASSMPALANPLGDLLSASTRAGLSGEATESRIGFALEVDNPQVHGFGSVDCASCHVATRIRRFAESALNVDSSGFEQRWRSSYDWNLELAMDPAEARNTRNLRAFGYFRRVPSISERTIHESARVAEAVSTWVADRAGGGGGGDTSGGCAEDTPDGCWEPVQELPYFVVHGALMPTTGTVLMYASEAEQSYPVRGMVWDPATGEIREHDLPNDLFCAGHAFLTDGSLLVVGGASTPGSGINDAHVFRADATSPGGGEWRAVAPLSADRWYATVVSLPDGRAIAVSGRTNLVELFSPASGGPGAWTTVEGADRSFPELYPILHLLPSGHVYYSRGGWTRPSGGSRSTFVLELTGADDPYTAGRWIEASAQQKSDRQEGTGVLFVDATTRDSRIMVIGGGTSPNDETADPSSAEVLDVPGSYDPSMSLTWRAVAHMHRDRTNVNAVILPNGRVLVVGGQSVRSRWGLEETPTLTAEMYDPRTNTWTLLPPMAKVRRYHSVALLLPDGRVLTAGGVDPSLGGPPERDQRNLQVFQPEYVRAPDRPAIASAPASARFGEEITVQLDEGTDGSRIRSVTLLRPIAVTHHTDANQRHVTLGFENEGNQLRVRAPDDGRLAPPGHYMLFVVDDRDVPSEAHFIRLSASD